MDRRICQAVSATIVFAVCLLQLTSHAATEPSNHFTHGPILGRLSSTGVGVWARTYRAGEFVVLYGTSPDQLSETSNAAVTEISRDNTGWVQLSGLKPDTKYYYQLIFPEDNKGLAPHPTHRAGSFRTLPSSEAMRDKQTNPEGLFNFSFEYACGNNQNPGQGLGAALPTFDTMYRQLKDEINFALLNGDWLYEVQREYSPQQWRSQVGLTDKPSPHVVQVAPTITGVWQNYKHFMDQGPNLNRWHANVPSFFTYDDHETLNDIWGAGSPGLRDRRAVFRDIGVRAWYDYLGWSNPTRFKSKVHFGKAQLTEGGDILVDPRADFTKMNFDDHSNLHVHWGTIDAGVNENELDGVGGKANAGVYEIVKVLDAHRLQISPPADATEKNSYSIGRKSYYKMRLANCEFFVCDTRGQRQMHDARDPYKKGLSHLGAPQKKWLLDGIAKSDAEFLFVVSSVNFMVPHVGGGVVRTSNKDDAWTVFYDEREQLIDAFDEIDKPVMVLTGDLHNSFVAKITDNVWEMASGPHNSNNHLMTDEGDRPANGRFQYGPRPIDIRWSTHFQGGVHRSKLLQPTYCVVQVNNVYENPTPDGQVKTYAYPKPHVIFRYFSGLTGKFLYSETLHSHKNPPLINTTPN